MRSFALLLILTFCINQLDATPPLPPKGKRWVLNETFSDEFNANKLDSEKWYNYHPQWKGRSPGLFVKDAVSVKDGSLQISNYKLKRDSIIWNWNHTDTDTFTVAGGAVRSKNNTAFFGYYECKFKASKTSMSTTFWLSSDHTVSLPGCETGKEKYGLELDIQECVGRVNDASKTWFTTGMNSNTHFHYTNCEGEKETRSRGTGVDSEIPNADVFNTYGAWWKNENEVQYIFNDTAKRDVAFRTDILEKPFNFSMAMNMVTETYDWISTPKTENLNDPSKNTSYYDWVRSYNLVDVDETKTIVNHIKNGDFETGTISGWEGWGGNPREIDNTQAYEGEYCMHIGGIGAPEQTLTLEPNTAYILTAYAKAVSGKVTFGIKNNTTNKHIQDIAISETEYKKYTIPFTTDSGSSFKVFYYASTANDEGFLDQVSLVEAVNTLPEETVMFPEQVAFTLKPTSLNNADHIQFTANYMANTTRELHLSILDETNNIVVEEIYMAYGGFGNKDLDVDITNKLQEGKNYKAILHIRPKNASDNSNAYASDEYIFSVVNPVEVRIQLTDNKTNLPIANAELTLNDSTLKTDKEGTAIFTKIPVQEHTLSATAEGYKTLSTQTINITKDTLLTYSLAPRLYRINIYIKDSINADPIKSARINLNNVNRTSDNLGKTSFNLYYGKYAYTIENTMYGVKKDTITISNSADVSLFMKRKFTDVRFSIKLDEKLLSNAKITLADQEKQTNVLGQASFSKIATNTPFTYTITHNEKLWAEKTMSFYKDTLLNIDLTATLLNKVTHKDLIAYPNPVSTSIKIKGLKTKTRYSIYQINGIFIKTGTISPNATIAVDRLKEGMYFIQLEDGSTISFVKI